MRPNLPSQIAQRLAAPCQKHWELLRILASCSPYHLAGTKNTIGLMTARLRRLGPLAQSYVG